MTLHICAPEEVPPGSVLSERTRDLIQRGFMGISDGDHGPHFLTEPFAAPRVVAAVVKRNARAAKRVRLMTREITS